MSVRGIRGRALSNSPVCNPGATQAPSVRHPYSQHASKKSSSVGTSSPRKVGVWKHRWLLQQDLETGLLKMLIACEGVLDLCVLHHHERNAVVQRPVLVAPGAEQMNALIEQVLCGRNNRGVRIGDNPSVKSGKRVSIPRLAERVADLGEHPRRCNPMPPIPSTKLRRPRVAVIFTVQNRQIKPRVSEDRAHFLGRPCR